MSDIALTELFAQPQQLIVDIALVEDEDHLCTVQGRNGLQGDLLGIPGPHADQQDLFHRSTPPLAEARS